MDKAENAECYLLESEHAGAQLAAVLVVAVGALLPRLQVPVHEGLQDGGERRDTDARSDEHGVLGAEDVARWSPERTVDVNLN